MIRGIPDLVLILLIFYGGQDLLNRVAPMLGFSGYQALIKAYIGQGLRVDLERLEGGVYISALIESLRKKGVKDEIISSAMAEVHSRT